MMIPDFIKQAQTSFSGRIFVSLFLVMLIMSAFYNAFFIDLQKQLLTTHTIHEGKGQAELLAYTVRLGVFAENKEQLRLPVEAVLRQNHVLAVTIFNVSGTPILNKVKPNNDLAANFTVLPQNDNKTTLAKNMKDCFCFQAPVLSRSSSLSAEKLFFEAEEATWQEETIGFVQLIVSKEQLRQGVETILQRNLILGIIFLALAAFITFIIVQQSTRPLEKLLAQVKNMSGAAEKNDEIELLQMTFTSLIDDLQSSFRTITDLKLNLEKKVAKRTVQLSQRHEELIEANQKLTKTLNKLQQAQSQLVQSEKMASLGQLVAGVAHEINNNTNFITGALPSLKRLIVDIKAIISCYTSQTSKHNSHNCDQEHASLEIFADVNILLDNISEGARRTSAIVQELRIFSRLDEEREKKMDIHKGLESTLTFIHPQYKDRIQIIRDYDATLPQITGMPGKINQVFMNILTNGMQDITDKGSITIQTWQQKQRIHISIKDTGSGICPENLTRIFDPFFSTKEPGVGTGLGLSISHTIMKEHKGEILVKSTEGEGTEFELILPLDNSYGNKG